MGQERYKGIVWEWSRTSKQERGCIRNSFSPGYCERKLMGAPASMRPTSISSTVPRSFFTPLYAKAVSLLVVADIRPNSTGGGTKRNMRTLFVGERWRKDRIQIHGRMLTRSMQNAVLNI